MEPPPGICRILLELIAVPTCPVKPFEEVAFVTKISPFFNVYACAETLVKQKNRTNDKATTANNFFIQSCSIFNVFIQ
ncbi:zinc-finger domain-containing protein [Listeria innocua]|uniref:zinc-finger domain-containing protein n=1 Tax=Listeria innocua TaxID=1642 RepID=UPI0035E3E5A6